MTIPEMSVSISTKLFDLPNRAHNAAGKQALTAELNEHHRNRIPGHFRQTARDKYGYQPRSRIYMAIKRKLFHSTKDLVRSGKTERMATSIARVRIGGTVTGSFRPVKGTNRVRVTNPGLIGNLIMRVAFTRGYRDPKDPRRVTTDQMAAEITAVTPAEEQSIAVGFGRRYVAALNAYSTGNRRARIYGARK